MKELKWQYRGHEIRPEDIPDWAIGFVYIIDDFYNTGINPKQYVGKKLLNSTRRKKIGIREKKATATRKRFKVEIKPSSWETYIGSCKPLQEEIKKRPEDFTKEILTFAFSKKNLHYLELFYQFQNKVLEIDSYNDNIGGTIFRKDVVNTNI